MPPSSRNNGGRYQNHGRAAFLGCDLPSNSRTGASSIILPAVKAAAKRMLDGHRVRLALRGIVYLETHHVAAGAEVEDHARLVPIAFRDRSVARHDARDVHFAAAFTFVRLLQRTF